MSLSATERKSELIEQVAERVHERVTTEHASATERFVRRFYAHVPPSDVVHDTTDNLYGAAIALWQLAEVRKPCTPKVRVYTPSADQDGWHSKHTIVEVVSDDMPFLLESLAAWLNRHDAQVQTFIHPVFDVVRDADGRLESCRNPTEVVNDGGRESFMHLAVAEQPQVRLVPLAEELMRVLGDVRAAVEDFPLMANRCEGIASEFAAENSEDLEGVAFLRWLLQDHFTFLGYRCYTFEGDDATAEPGTGSGLLRDDIAHVFEGLLTGGRRPAELDSIMGIRITKTNRDSTVHRPVPMDAIGIKRYGPNGEVTGEHVFIGLFTSRAYSLSPRDIPILRSKVEQVLSTAGFHPDSYDHKTLVHILDTYPRDELYQIPLEQLQDIALGILQLHERPNIAFFPRIDPFERYASCLIFVPRDRYGTELRLRFQEILEKAFDGKVSNYYTRLTTEAHARLLLYVRTTPGQLPAWDADEIQSLLVEASRSWQDRLRTALIEERGEQGGLEAYHRYGAAFPSSYRDTYSAEVGVKDIASLDAAIEGGSFTMNLYRALEAREHEACFKLYSCGGAAPLSDILPVLENMGLRVQREVPYRVRPRDFEREVWISDFELASHDDTPIDLATVRDGFHEAFTQTWSGQHEDDGFNHLVLRANLSARQISVLRAYCKYLRQAQVPFSQEYMERTLAAHPQVARQLIRLFETRFDPSADDGREARASAIVAELEHRFESITSLDEDRILHSFLTVIEATVRTNHYQTDEDGAPKPYLSFKLESHKVPGLPKPRPLYEIFVFSVRMEGVHLRGGLVARGGLRWSDRLEDFRTEVHGLMKAQMVKNAVIVPVGSKGGFVVKRPPADSNELWDEVVYCYRTLISGLLDITDNLDGHTVVPPPQVVRRDGDDPYLVVAADKGTATFSDTANGVAADYGFWLDDAFASGGSVGYDHKKMGITARGAWESVKRHFREMNKDIQKEDFTAIGIGDMGGDVFGNGMLLSKHTRLIAAFNHMHIFIDPTPDAAKSFVERQRLFDLPRSTWADYDESLLSEGGGVYARNVKSIPLNDQMRTLFGLEGERVTPNELIHTILQADVELMWLGGIGTYVRASHEADTAVGDRANDAVRITAQQLRAQVVGEGANLGLTQPARIEYAQHGGRINTDAIDNSAGVDCSDHEVNIKIFLGEIVRAGDLTREQRDALLAEMTDEVGELVLRDNYLQTQSISVSQFLGPHLLDRFAHFIRRQERSGRLDRGVEFLPDDEELADRSARGTGLTRPELSVLLAYAKMELYDFLVASELPDDPALVHVLEEYFPAPLRERFADRMGAHRLRREIIATVVTNEIINRVGLGFGHEVGEKTGHTPANIARAYIIAKHVFGIGALWAEIESLDNQIPAALQADLLADCGRLVERATVWFLRQGQMPLDIEAEIARFRPGVAEVMANLDAVLGDNQRLMLATRQSGYEERGTPTSLAFQIARFPALTAILDVICLAADDDLPAPDVARVHAATASHFGFDWLRRAAGHLPSDTAWDKLAITALLEDLEAEHVGITRRILATSDRSLDPQQAIQDWAATLGPLATRTEQMISELQAQGHVDFQMLAVATRRLKAMSE